MKIELRRIPMPEFDVPAECPVVPAEEYASRLRDFYAACGKDWVAVYGDREHNANVLFLTGFDPRFEDAMLLLGPDGHHSLFVGNEDVAYAEEAGMPMNVVLYQPFSLMGQPRETSKPLADLLRDAGVQHGNTVGIVGWKYLAEGDVEDASIPAYVPAFIVSTFWGITGAAPVDVTAHLMDPVKGLRNRSSAAQIARYEWGASRASAAVLRMVMAAEPGMSELDVVPAMQYAGEPFAAHLMFTTSNGQVNGLLSPSSRVIDKGDGVSTGVAYWGGLCCRAGVITDGPDDEFFTDYVQPYFASIVTWWQSIGIGVTGGEIHETIHTGLADAPFKPALNPGHLGSFDEWVHSPIRPGSEEQLASGMVFQCDIIPSPLPDSRGLNCEDTVAIADEALREEIARDFPELWSRIEARRRFMTESLGFELKPEILPLSVAPGYLPPYWMDHELVCVVS
jgi:Xaa-Pro aminopeptidase